MRGAAPEVLSGTSGGLYVCPWLAAHGRVTDQPQGSFSTRRVSRPAFGSRARDRARALSGKLWPGLQYRRISGAPRGCPICATDAADRCPAVLSLFDISSRVRRGEALRLAPMSSMVRDGASLI